VIFKVGESLMADVGNLNAFANFIAKAVDESLTRI